MMLHGGIVVRGACPWYALSVFVEGLPFTSLLCRSEREASDRFADLVRGIRGEMFSNKEVDGG